MNAFAESLSALFCLSLSRSAVVNRTKTSDSLAFARRSILLYDVVDVVTFGKDVRKVLTRRRHENMI